MTAILLPIPRTPFLDNRGYPTREWYRFLSQLQQAVGGSTDVIVDFGTTNPPSPPSDTGALDTALQADAFASQNAGQIEELASRFDGLDPQIRGPQEFAQVEAALAALTRFGLPPIELGSLEAAKNIGYRVLAAGSAALVAGTVTVNNINANSANQFMLTAKIVGGVQGILSVGTITANTSFVINSTNALDTSTVSWVILGAVKG